MKKALSSNIQLDVETQLKLSQALVRIAGQLNKAKELESAVKKLMHEFLEISNADEGAIQLLRPASATTRCTLVRQEEKPEGLLDQQLDDFLTGKVLYQRTGIKTNDINDLLQGIQFPQKYAAITSAIAVPLLNETEIIGAVNLIQTGDEFSDIDFTLVSDFATQIGQFIDNARLREKLFAENERLQINLENRFSIHGVIGNSPSIKMVFSTLEQIIPTDARVVLLGESGTGKELIAKCIHYEGPRKDRPFVAIDCGALPANLLESELFGYVRGAFTGAMRDRMGLIEHAHTGTLFLDEITNMGLETQSKLLRVIQEEEIRPLGSNQTRKVDVRIIVAASENLAEHMKNGTFRSDLYYRLNVITLLIPPLRDRVQDIPVLAQLFLKRFSEKHGKTLHKISPKALHILEQYSWPGNIRELENIIERAVVLIHYDETELSPVLLPEIILESARPQKEKFNISGDLKTLMENYECELLRQVLIAHNWNQSAAARALNISEGDIRYKMKKLNIEPIES